MLIQVTNAHALGPFDFAVIRLELARNDVHEGGFPFTVGADESDMLAFQQAEGYIVEDRAVSKAVT